MKLPRLNPYGFAPPAKAILVCGLASATAIIGGALAYLRLTDPVVLTALLSFYVTLTINTYYSVKTFASITPSSNVIQNIMDTYLLLLYLLAGYSIGYPVQFWSITLVLFVSAPIKYFHLRSLVDRPKLIRRKMLLDLLAAALVASALAGTVLLNVTGSATLTAATFAIANVYLLYIEPMYGIID
jgi:hypothetical protein